MTRVKGEDPPRRKVSLARCPAAESLLNALKKAFGIVLLEFGLQYEPLVSAGHSCSSIRQKYEESVVAITAQGKSRGLSMRRMMRLRSALSSMKRLFDAPCRCDQTFASIAIEEWKERMSNPRPVNNLIGVFDPIWLLQRRVRELCRGWGSYLPAARSGELEGENLYFPDQQGCLELKAHNGGTLGVSYDEESYDSSAVRLGAAKTKGKLRVVSMQSARVKRVLSPVHNALYTHISRFGWCVRGEVTKEDFIAVQTDRRSGEDYINGDYEAATDNISLCAVRAIVDVLCEESQLTEEESCVLYESFNNLRWFDPCTGSSGHIRRGSMMGNLVSFPLLCLLNKACFDISCDIYYGPGSARRGRFNGDDCSFCGDSQFYQLWVRTTGTFGLIVNHKKTSRSRRFLELNSTQYDTMKSRFVDKPVLSFFRRKEDSPECLISDILKGMRGFRRDLVLYVINHSMRYECSIRRPAVANIPKSWLKTLLRKRWFRESLTRDPPPLFCRGVDRSERSVLGPPPRPRFYQTVSKMCLDSERDRLAKWKGVHVKKFSSRLSRTELGAYMKNKGPPSYVSIGRPFWSFLWPRPVWELVSERFPAVLCDRRARSKKWIEDHPRLHVETPVLSVPHNSYLSKLLPTFAPCLSSEAILCKDVNFLSSESSPPAFWRL
ncbi:RNA dependent RNA polymerase [Plasmopara viticola lesion associated ourmia-like virus 61]|uniref:RNA dependent RNA polymerase n=1 Tax=Plasmopara viticola lesion associated ourmia-like virus 61 TaxID=2686533 RepID=A0ABX6FJX9_9VIRU|nr:RNA dependent RNA polymerase [Plasmopara viticola lesion associated ourmia-like virus 61]QGY72591.1 RNA dependent RNA polymerase [Plasmopara viticola lesion associated ourmia-like virus 61]